ncbi:MAG: GNAT family N-acetyltransferase [Tissierellia bacterium]|nr:GNAT family N-acetyltransferase [Tissierellia bacterium]
MDTIEVCASINALSFYQDMGYLVQGDFFTRDNIQHVFVVKEI